MRNLVLPVALLFLISGAASALPQDGYIGLLANESRSCWCVSGVGFYPAEMWIWCLPSVRGQMCAEFAICYPPNVIQSTVTWNDPVISVSLGDLPSGFSVCFVECQMDWFWIGHQLLYVTDMTKTIVQICPHPDVGVYQFANCNPDYPTEPCKIFIHLYINYQYDDPECGWCLCPARESSWSVIKKMLGGE